jgi:hypothetical protein
MSDPHQELAEVLGRLFAGEAIGTLEKAKAFALMSKVRPLEVLVLTVGQVVRRRPQVLAALRQVLDAAEDKPRPSEDDRAAGQAKPASYW